MILSLRNKTCWIATLLVAAVCLRAVDTAHGQAIDQNRAAKVKAAYLVNFAKYTEWPSTSFESSESPLIITMVGGCDLNGPLRENLRSGDRIANRPVVIQNADYPAATGENNQQAVNNFYEVLRKSHVVYFCAADAETLRVVLKHLRGLNILTVSDAPGFCDAGGMLGLVLKENRFVFQANPGEIRKVDLVVSAKVLKLADIVQTRSEMGRP